MFFNNLKETKKTRKGGSMDRKDLIDFLKKRREIPVNDLDREMIERSLSVDLALTELAENGGTCEEACELLGVPKIDSVMLVHPRNEEDMFNRYPFMRKISRRGTREIQEAHWIATLDIATYGDCYIPIVCLPLTPEYFIPDLHDREGWKHRQEILREKEKNALDLVNLFCKDGDLPLILGALTGRIGRQLRKGGFRGPLVTGTHITPPLIVGMIEKIATISSIPSQNFKIAIVGAAGSMGKTILSWLIAEGFSENLTLIEATKTQTDAIKRFFPLLRHKQITEDITRVKEQDIVIVATAAPHVLIDEEMLSPGTIILDDTHPANVARNIERKDTLVLRVMAEVPGIDYIFPMDQINKTDTVTCLAEGCILAKNDAGIRQKHLGLLGKNDLALMLALSDLSERLGIGFPTFRDYRGFVSDQEVIDVISLR